MLRPRVQYCTFTACPWPWRAKGKGLGGIWGLWLLFTSKNLTLCPDGTKSGLQLMGTRLSSKGHLARISHTLTHTHTHISNPRYTHANWFSAWSSHPFCAVWHVWVIKFVSHLHVTVSRVSSAFSSYTAKLYWDYLWMTSWCFCTF